MRGAFIDILQNRAMPLTERILCLGVIIQRLQREDWSSFDPDGWVEQTAVLGGSDTIKEMAAKIRGNRDMYLMQNLNVLGAIPSSKKSWSTEIYNALEAKRKVTVSATENVTAGKNAEITVNFSKQAYADALTQFQAVFSNREYFFENLMVASALYLRFPDLDSKEKLWKSYVCTNRFCCKKSVWRNTKLKRPLLTESLTGCGKSMAH